MHLINQIELAAFDQQKT